MSSIHQQILETFEFRHACKQFDPGRKIPDADFRVLLETARLSPSSFGFEPWKFLVLQDPALREKIYPVSWGAQRTLRDASHFVVFLARKKADTLAGSPYLQRIMEETQGLSPEVQTGKVQFYSNFQKNDFELLDDERYLFDWASKQTYIALANMLTAAAWLKIDSCPIEGFHKKALEEILQREGLLDLDHFGVSVLASFGYRAQNPSRGKTRQRADQVIQWVGQEAV